VKSRIRNGMRRMRATLVESGIEERIDDESRRSERTVAVAALHAVDAEPCRDRGARHTCPRCQSELDSYRAVAAAIGNSVENCRGLWTNISSQLWITKVNRR